MNVIVLGLLYTERSLRETERCSRQGAQMAPHTFQTSLLQGMRQIPNLNVSVYSIPPCGSFLINDKRLFIREESVGAQRQIGYCNLPLIKRLEQRVHLYRHLRQALAKTAGEETLIVAYSPYEPFLSVIGALKRKFPSVKSCLIVTDCIPGRGDLRKNMTLRARLRGRRMVRMAHVIDRFALLTRYLADAIEVGNRPYVITECICDDNLPVCQGQASGRNVCLYVGSVHREFNICALARAFAMMDNAELWICGDGNAREEMTAIAEQHDNIRYFGYVRQEELQTYRDACDFLINPRRPTGTYTKYSFPSKTAEYMASGKPTVMYRLEGVPEEYDAYLNYLSGETPAEIKAELEALFAKDYASLREKAMRARTFMKTMKSSVRQAEKIVFGVDDP